MYRGSIHWSTRLLSTTVDNSAAKANHASELSRFVAFYELLSKKMSIDKNRLRGLSSSLSMEWVAFNNRKARIKSKYLMNNTASNESSDINPDEGVRLGSWA